MSGPIKVKRIQKAIAWRNTSDNRQAIVDWLKEKYWIDRVWVDDGEITWIADGHCLSAPRGWWVIYTEEDGFNSIADRDFLLDYFADDEPATVSAVLHEQLESD